ncbi:MAG TPA: sulfotransferase [bacterium]|jgi:hypothetical protein|nr:sulfotransferase [bacterium]
MVTRGRPARVTQATRQAALARAVARAIPARAARWLRHPVFIIGCGRSGTTLLRNHLGAHPQVAAFPSEADALWHPGLLPWSYSRRPAPPIWADPIRFTELSIAGWPSGQNVTLRAVFGAFQRIARGTVFLQKNIKLNFMLARVASVFPEARFIHMVRDGRAAAVAYARKMRATIDFAPERFRLEGYDLPLETLMEYFARYWSQIVLTLDRDAAALGLAGTAAWREVRYEAFCADPAAAMGDLAGWLGLDPAPFRTLDLSRIQNTNAQIIGRVPAEQRAALEALMAPALIAKGYVSA